MRCPHCPVRAGLDCLGEKAPPLCLKVAEGQPGRAEQLRGIAENNPSLLEMAANLARSVVAHVADGGRQAPPEVQAQRKAACLACPLHDAAAGRCLKCGCSAMNVKRSWASSACPDDPPRWTAV